MEGGCFNGSSSSRQMCRTSPVPKQYEVGDYPKHPNKGVSFIKVLGRDFSKQLHIPQEFTKNFNGHIPHRFIIESAMTKKCWRVEVETDGDGRMYFREGWGDFVEAHSLEVGNFVVFEYEEQSIFQVKIYGINGCEKTLTDVKSRSHHEHENTIVIEEDGESDTFDNEENMTRKRPRRKMRKLSIKKYGQGIHKKQRAGTRVHVPTERDHHIRTTKVSISENSVSFSITIHKRKKHQFYQVHIPKAVLLHKKLSSKEKVLLQDAKGNCWPITLARRNDGRGIFSGGWKEFLADNKIAPGDTIYFEFRSDDIIQVKITRASEIEHHCEEEKRQNEATGSLNMDCEHDEPGTTNNEAVGASITRRRVPSELTGSSFSIMWTEKTTGRYLYIPKVVVAHQKLKNNDKVVLRDPEGKCWPFEVRTWSDGRVGLIQGWLEFWKGHGITVGDSLSFKFVSNCLIQVTINRGRPLEPAIEGAVTTSAAIVMEGAVITSEAIVKEGAAN